MGKMFAVLNFFVGVYFTDQTVYRPEIMRYLPVVRKTAIANEILIELQWNLTQTIVIQCSLQSLGQLLDSVQKYCWHQQKSAKITILWKFTFTLIIFFWWCITPSNCTQIVQVDITNLSWKFYLIWVSWTDFMQLFNSCKGRIMLKNRKIDFLNNFSLRDISGSNSFTI